MRPAAPGSLRQAAPIWLGFLEDLVADVEAAQGKKGRREVIRRSGRLLKKRVGVAGLEPVILCSWSLAPVGRDVILLGPCSKRAAKRLCDDEGRLDYNNVFPLGF